MSKVKLLKAVLKDFRQEFNKANIEAAVQELTAQHQSIKVDDLEVPFDADGNLLDSPEPKMISRCTNPNALWSQRQHVLIHNPNYLPPKPNMSFIDAIKFHSIPDCRPRHGCALFYKLDGSRTTMSNVQFKIIRPLLTHDWLIGEFCHNIYYGNLEIKLIKQLIK